MQDSMSFVAAWEEVYLNGFKQYLIHIGVGFEAEVRLINEAAARRMTKFDQDHGFSEVLLIAGSVPDTTKQVLLESLSNSCDCVAWYDAQKSGFNVIAVNKATREDGDFEMGDFIDIDQLVRD